MGKGKGGVRLHVPEWKEDVVYLFQFPRTKHLPNISPYCLKVESFLRLHGVKYEVRETFKLRSSQGLLPMIELNGRQVGDSGLIIAHLKKTLNIQDYSDDKEAAQGRVISKACDAFTAHTIYKYKILDNSKNFAGEIMTAAKMPNFAKGIATALFARQIRKSANMKIGAQLGIWPDGAHEEMVRDELQMYETLLKNFVGHNLFGDKITEADLTLWSHLATTLYMPFDLLPQKLIREDFPHLKSFTERLRDKLWPDWEKADFTPQVSPCK
ncbi:unnamed protein product, partial [Mesorhabditis belari]|uniref:Glutathione S-transferase n=1 Tax=Mesorhabditis belari TaxID=2138241 RepID=A0AAF3EYV5_9BILA